MSKNVRSLGEILPPELAETDAKPLDDWLDKPLVFHGMREVTGSFGTYARISVSEPDNDDHFIVATGASQPMMILQWATDNRAFPFLARFTRVDRAILLKPTE